MKVSDNFKQVNIFVCSTMYHVLLSSLIAQTVKESGSNILVLDCTCYPNAHNYDWDSLSPLFDEALIFEDQEMQLSSITEYLFYKRSVKKKMEQKFPLLKKIREDYSKSLLKVNCYINEDGHNFSRYFIYYFRNIVMLEEGMQIYKAFVRNEAFWLKFLKYRVLGIIRPNGVDERIREIWVQYPEKLPITIRHKGVRIDLSELFFKMEESDCLDVFKHILGFSGNIMEILREVFAEKEDITLLITQPFSEDKLISEAEKIDIYKKIVQSIELNNSQAGCLIIKPHPRETTDYSQIFDNAIIIPNGFPMEMIRFAWEKKDIGISFAVTVDSTAILNIKEFCERIQVYGNCDITKTLSSKYPLKEGYVMIQ